jgi:lambda family phage portal protein
MANWLDRAIGWVAPAAGARRLRQRAAFDVLSKRENSDWGGGGGWSGGLPGRWSGYDGARHSRRTMSWRTGLLTSADNEIARAGPWLRERMRDLVRNNPHAANAVSVLQTHIVGDGIVPRAKTGKERLDKKVNDLFARWSKECDASGQLDFCGLQALAVRGMLESGDGLVRRRYRPLSDGLLPLQLQVIETDLIDHARNMPTPGGGITIQGVELDKEGKRVAYWLFNSHPGNANFDPRASLTSRSIPSSEVAHVYEKQRTQVRGVPWGTPTIMALRDLGSYEEAEMVRKRIESCMVGILIGGDENDGVGIPLEGEQTAGFYDQQGTQIDRFEPGMFAVARGGKDVKFNTPAVTMGFETWRRASLHTIAAGFRVPYALLSGDLSQVNYSSSKIGLEVFKRLISQVQWQLVIPMLCEPLWRWFIEAAFQAEEIDTVEIPVEWSPPKFYSADPLKDLDADLAEVRAGFKSPQEAITERGRDPDDVIGNIIAWNAKIDAAGIILDSDPRKVSKVGQMQATEEPLPVSAAQEESTSEDGKGSGGKP